MPIAQAIAQDRLRIDRIRKPAPQVFLRKSRQEIHGPPEPETNLKSPDQPSPISSGRSVRMIAPKRLPRSSKRTGLLLFPTPICNNTHTSQEYRNPVRVPSPADCVLRFRYHILDSKLLTGRASTSDNSGCDGIVVVLAEKLIDGLLATPDTPKRAS